MCQGRSQNWAGGQRDTQTLGTLRSGWQQVRLPPTLVFSCQPLWGGEWGLGSKQGATIGSKEFARAGGAESRDTLKPGPGSNEFPSLSGELPSDRTF